MGSAADGGLSARIDATSVDQPPLRTSQRIRAERARSRPHGLGAMLLAFSVIFVLAWVFIVRQPQAPPAPTLAAVAGSYTWQSSASDPAGRRGGGTFAAVGGGDARGTFASSGETVTDVVSSYDAGARRARASGGVSQGTSVTVGAWPPAWRLATRSPLDYQGLSAIVRAAVEDGDNAVGTRPLEQDGRKVWRAAMTLDGSTLELVVDQTSGLVTWYTDGASEFEAEVDWGATPEMDEATSPAVPTQATVLAVDRTYAYVPTLRAAGTVAGFDPVSSGLAPDGFAQAAAATAPAGDAPSSWDAHGSADGERQVAQLFLRGLTWFEVRQVGGPAASSAALARAVQAARATTLSFEQTQVHYGVFAGRTASTWYAASGPTLLVGDGRRTVYVTGALTRQELLSLAEGFKPLGAGTAASPGATTVSPAAAP